MANNSAKSFDDPTFREAVRKKVGKRFKGDLFESGYQTLLLKVSLRVAKHVKLEDDKEIIEEALSDALGDFNQGDDYNVLCLDSEILAKDLIVYTVLIRTASAIYNDWPHGQELYDHIEDYLIDEDIISLNIKSLAK
jgi:hypothetical protein